VLHLYFLHFYTSSNPLGVNSTIRKVSFHYYYIIKDIFYLIVFIFIFLVFRLRAGFIFIDAENFIPANPIVTPNHIQPEWYFLYAYAILRSVPNKLGGVLIIVIRVGLIALYPQNSVLFQKRESKGKRILFWTLVMIFFLLTWLGASPAKFPYILISQIITFMYFLINITIIFLNSKNK